MWCEGNCHGREISSTDPVDKYQKQSAKSEKGSEVEPSTRGVVVVVVEGVKEIPNITWIPAG